MEHWSAAGPEGLAEVYIGPSSLLTRAGTLPIWGPFPEVRTGRMPDGRSFAVVLGTLSFDLEELTQRLAPGAAVAFAWHITSALAEVHERGGAHGALHPSFVGLDARGRLTIRPAFAASLPSEPDPQASAQATDCLQLDGLLDVLDLDRIDEPALALLRSGLGKERARFRIQPGRSARQALAAIAARHPDWEASLVESFGAEWRFSNALRMPPRPVPSPEVAPLRVPVVGAPPSPRVLSVNIGDAAPRPAEAPLTVQVGVPARPAEPVPPVRVSAVVAAAPAAVRPAAPSPEGLRVALAPAAPRAEVPVERPDPKAAASVAAPVDRSAPSLVEVSAAVEPAATLPVEQTIAPDWAAAAEPPAPSLSEAPAAPQPDAPAAPQPEAPAAPLPSAEGPRGAGPPPVSWGGALPDAASAAELPERPGPEPVAHEQAEGEHENNPLEDDLVQSAPAAPALGRSATAVAVDDGGDEELDEAVDASVDASVDAAVEAAVDAKADAKVDAAFDEDEEDPPTNHGGSPVQILGLDAEDDAMEDSFDEGGLLSALSLGLAGEELGLEPSAPSGSASVFSPVPGASPIPALQMGRSNLEPTAGPAPVLPPPAAPFAPPHLAPLSAPPASALGPSAGPGALPAAPSAEDPGDGPRWSTAGGVVGDARREAELGAGKWTEPARSPEQVQAELGAGAPREIPPMDDGRGSKVFLIIGVVATLGLVAWWVLAG